MSDDVNAKLLARLAALETELATLRSTPRNPQVDIAKSMATDPVGTLAKMGVPVEHMTRVLVAHAMGDQAPPELRALAAMGPQVSATNALASNLEAVSRRLEAYETREKETAVRQSFKALTADKSKYPALSKALAADPTFFDEDLGRHGGSAEDFAATMEARLQKVLPVATPPASDGNAAGQQAQSIESKPAPNQVDPTPPPIARPKQGVFTKEDHQTLRDEIVRKYQPVPQ